MKKNLIKIHVLALVICVVATSCQDNILEPRNDNQELIDRVMRDPAYAEGLLLSGYRRLPTEYTFSEVATDDAVTNDKSNNYMRMATGEWSSLFSPISSWDNAYAAIFHLNLLLSVVNDVEWSWQSASRNQLFIAKNSGEAHALRGYFYLDLLQNHGGPNAAGQILGVPIITKPLGITDVWKLPRSSFQDVINQIYADFDKALELLPNTWHSNYSSDDSLRVFGVQNRGRIQGTIIKALKSKAALLAASPAYNGGEYPVAKAAEAASLAAPLLIERGGASGLPPKGVIFYDADNDITNPEILWRNNHATNNTLEKMNYPPSLWGEGRINPTQNLVDAFPMRNGYPIDHAQSGFNPSNPYANRDTRLDANIVRHGTVLRSTTINVSPESPTLDGLNLSIYSTRTGYYLKKLLRVNVNLNPTSTTTARHFYTHMRYTEVYLNYAEAANEAWGPDGDPNGYGFTARSIVQRIRQRAQLTQPDAYLNGISTKEEMRAVIRNERRLELCFEGHRFWDLRRWQLALTVPARGVSIVNGSFNTINVENRIFSMPASYYGPIPQQEILKNDLLQQNNGW